MEQRKPPGDGWLSVQDLVQIHGMHRQTVQKRLRGLMREGRLEASYDWRPGLSPGRLFQVPVYRLKA